MLDFSLYSCILWLNSMDQRISGRIIASAIKEEVTKKVATLKEQGILPKLAVVLVGDDKPSETYVRKKGTAAQEVGMDFELHKFDGDITEEQLLANLAEIQADDDLSGIIVQLPLPKHIDTNTILNAIKPELDVDCLTDINLGRIVMQTNTLIPPTPAAVLSILEHMNIDITGKNITIVGTGQLVGRPLSIVLVNTKASVTTCNETTTNIKEKCLQADVIVSGVGKPDIIRGDMVKKGTIVIDTGVSYSDTGKLQGDVHMQEMLDAGAFVTPTPGGVGPITVAQLLQNTVISAKNKVK